MLNCPILSNDSQRLTKIDNLISAENPVITVFCRQKQGETTDEKYLLV